MTVRHVPKPMCICSPETSDGNTYPGQKRATATAGSDMLCTFSGCPPSLSSLPYYSDLEQGLGSRHRPTPRLPRQVPQRQLRRGRRQQAAVVQDRRGRARLWQRRERLVGQQEDDGQQLRVDRQDPREHPGRRVHATHRDHRSARCWQGPELSPVRSCRYQGRKRRRGPGRVLGHVPRRLQVRPQLLG